LEQLSERASPTSNLADLPSYQRLSSLVKETTGATSDLQWYRARYLLSAGLRDILDSGQAYDGQETAQPVTHDHGVTFQNGEESSGAGGRDDLIKEAKKYAAEVALELEEKLREPGSLPEAFVAHGRSAALTLVARQVLPKTSRLEDVVTTGEGRPDYTDDSIRRALRNVLSDEPEEGTAERIVEFVRTNCPLDDQAQYNLYRYHRTRTRSLGAAIESWTTAIRDARARYGDDLDTDWQEDVLAWRDGLEEMYETELRQLHGYARQVLDAKDPVLVDNIETLLRDDPEPPSDRGGHRRDRRSEGRSRLLSPAPPSSPPIRGGEDRLQLPASSDLAQSREIGIPVPGDGAAELPGHDGQELLSRDAQELSGGNQAEPGVPVPGEPVAEYPDEVYGDADNPEDRYVDSEYSETGFRNDRYPESGDEGVPDESAL
jgi:hypothetical protein